MNYIFLIFMLTKKQKLYSLNLTKRGQPQRRKTMTFEECARELYNSLPEGKEDTIYSDGANDWTLDNLIDYCKQNDTDPNDYVIQDGEIWTIDEDGYLGKRVLEIKR